MPAQLEDRSPELVRGLGMWDGVLLVVGSVIGTGVFITGGDMARVLPHGGLLLLAWLVGGLLTLAGALTYAELGVMLPGAGGIFHFLKEAYGPFPAFLYGWSCFLVVFSGGIAAIAVGFAEYLGAFVPACSTTNILCRVSVAGFDWQLSGGQLAAVAAIPGKTVSGTVKQRPDYVSEIEWQVLQNVTKNQPDSDKKLTDLVNKMLFIKKKQA
ncbi:MAG TPA: amino acid permease, partial [Thermoanaerobaculaceae bacterium]|nr:amino acid permease [Thermoanaerobaculaceae bacterium]